MKTKVEDYTFSQSEVRILKEVAKGKHAFSEIGATTSVRPSLLSFLLKKPLRKGITSIEEKGFRKYVYFSDSKHAILLRELLLVYDYVNWETILSGSTLKILFRTLENGRNLQKYFSKATLWRHLRDLKSHGILSRTDDGYSINPRFSILAEFLTEYQKYLVGSLVRSISENAVILWQKDFECLIRVPKNVKIVQGHFFRTATSCFSDIGIPLLSDFNIYFYSKNKKRIHMEDILLHTLLIERDNVRYVIYSLLLLKKFWRKINKQYLNNEAKKFDLSLQIQGMLEFLKTHGLRKGLTLPKWEEFREKAKEYGVVVD